MYRPPTPRQVNLVEIQPTNKRGAMDPYISKLDTPERCEQYAQNVQTRSPKDAQAARRKAVELRAQKYGAKTDPEREAIQAVYAYERVQSEKKGKAFHASRTWQMINNRGIIPSIEHIVKQSSESVGYTALVEMGMKDMAFEAVVLRYPNLFGAQAVERSKERMIENNL